MLCTFCGWPPPIFVQNAHARVPRFAYRIRVEIFQLATPPYQAPLSLFWQPSQLFLSRLSLSSYSDSDSEYSKHARLQIENLLSRPNIVQQVSQGIVYALSHTHTATHTLILILTYSGYSQLLTDLSCQFVASGGSEREREIDADRVVDILRLPEFYAN